MTNCASKTQTGSFSARLNQRVPWTVEQERRPVPYLRIAAFPRSWSASETRKRGPLGATTETKVSFCRLAGGNSGVSVTERAKWTGTACALHRAEKKAGSKLLLPPPASQQGSTACRTPSSLLSSLPTSICTPLPQPELNLIEYVYVFIYIIIKS